MGRVNFTDTTAWMGCNALGVSAFQNQLIGEIGRSAQIAAPRRLSAEGVDVAGHVVFAEGWRRQGDVKFSDGRS